MVVCGHSGTVAIQSAVKLSVASSPVLVAASIDGKTVKGCMITPSSVSAKCKTVSTGVLGVTAITAGRATKLTVGGQPVILETLKGDTDGIVASVTPQTLLAGTANQNQLTAS